MKTRKQDRFPGAQPTVWCAARTFSASMLIYYAFDDADNTAHEGYFWYNCETGQVKAVLELDEE